MTPPDIGLTALPRLWEDSPLKMYVFRSFEGMAFIDSVLLQLGFLFRVKSTSFSLCATFSRPLVIISGFPFVALKEIALSTECLLWSCYCVLSSFRPFNLDFY